MVEDYKENEYFEVENWDDAPVFNVLEKGRYIAQAKDLKTHIADSGNNCIHATFQIEGVAIHKYFILSDIEKIPHKMAYQWKQYLYACGIRDPKRNFRVPKEKLLDSKCYVDIVKVPERDNPDIFKNEIRGFSPIEEEIAPIKDVPSEVEQINEITKKAIDTKEPKEEEEEL